MLVEHVEETAAAFDIGELRSQIHLASKQAVSIIEYTVQFAGSGKGVLVVGNDISLLYDIEIALLHIAHIFQLLASPS